VLAANRAFYDAFNERDMAAMSALWSRRADLTCVHPHRAVLAGRAEVLRSWRAILGHPEQPKIVFAAELPRIVGDVGIVSGREVVAAVPIAAAITSATRHGVLIKGGSHLEELARLRAVAVDKPGIITTGEPYVRELRPVAGRSGEEVLARLLSIERRSAQRLSRALARACFGRGRMWPRPVPTTPRVRLRPTTGVTSARASTARACSAVSRRARWDTRTRSTRTSR